MRLSMAVWAMTVGFGVGLAMTVSMVGLVLTLI